MGSYDHLQHPPATLARIRARRDRPLTDFERALLRAAQKAGLTRFPRGYRALGAPPSATLWPSHAVHALAARGFLIRSGHGVEMTSSGDRALRETPPAARAFTETEGDWL